MPLNGSDMSVLLRPRGVPRLLRACPRCARGCRGDANALSLCAGGVGTSTGGGFSSLTMRYTTRSLHAVKHVNSWCNLIPTTAFFSKRVSRLWRFATLYQPINAADSAICCIRLKISFAFWNAQTDFCSIAAISIACVGLSTEGSADAVTSPVAHLCRGTAPRPCFDNAHECIETVECKSAILFL